MSPNPIKACSSNTNQRLRWTLAIAIAGSALSCLAQGPPTPPLTSQPPTTFEVASIRRNISSSNGTHVDITHGRLTITNGSLRTLIRNAYDIQNYQFAGGPVWLDSDGYDIAATTGTGQETSNEQYRALIKGLLADRFKLMAHWETRQTNVYALILARNGLKLKEYPAPSKEPGLNTNISSHEGRMVGTNVPLSYLASVLGNKLGRTVLDKTGLQGKYDWTLVWDPDPTADSTAPSIFTAIQEQIGLKLDSQKGPTQFLVIDSVERPSEN